MQRVYKITTYSSGHYVEVMAEVDLGDLDMMSDAAYERREMEDDWNITGVTIYTADGATVRDEDSGEYILDMEAVDPGAYPVDVEIGWA